jgi:hypothetical protein
MPVQLDDTATNSEACASSARVLLRQWHIDSVAFLDLSPMVFLLHPRISHTRGIYLFSYTTPLKATASPPSPLKSSQHHTTAPIHPLTSAGRLSRTPYIVSAAPPHLHCGTFRFAAKCFVPPITARPRKQQHSGAAKQYLNPPVVTDFLRP